VGTVVSSSVNNQRSTFWPGGGGRTTGVFTRHSMLNLVTTGARTGLRRVTALAYLSDDRGYVVVAANGGAPCNPGWYHNLLADPHGSVEVDDRVVDVVAEVVTGPLRDDLYQRFTAQSPQLELYQAATTRTFPVIVLVPAQT
jgi:deazaflavin-dependent oxidoreductase (nitroreductase family)